MRLTIKLLIAIGLIVLAQSGTTQLPSLFPGVSPDNPTALTGRRCSVQDFYVTAVTNHDPSERHTLLLKWLNTKGSLCSSSEYILIWNGVAAWAGTSDTPQLRGSVIEKYEKALERERK